jgi:elongation factor G
VAVRETVRRRAEAEALFAPPPLPEAKHPALMARALVAVAPLARGAGLAVDPVPALVLPEGAAPAAGSAAGVTGGLSGPQRQAIESGLRGVLESGPIQGAPLLDLEVRVREVELFGPGSTPEALGAAAGKALRRALESAEPALMRPIMALEVLAPEINLGSVLGDLQSRGAAIQDSALGGAAGEGLAEIRALAPLAGLLGYATTLRSLTQGRGQFSMEFLRFDL